MPEALDSEGQFSPQQILAVPVDQQSLINFEQKVLPQDRHHFLVSLKNPFFESEFIL